MRVVYSCFFYLLFPAIFLRLLWRSIKASGYRHRWLERLAFYPQNYADHVLWFHAVSVGEVESLAPLIRQMQARHPAAKLLVTTTTPTGSDRVKALLPDSVSHVYLPYDVPDAVARFMRQFKPRLAVIMETEIWPNLYAYCGKNQIPLYLINARLSGKSVRGYRKIAALVRPALAQTKLIAAQSKEDGERFVAIGADAGKVVTLGNIKFDVAIAPEIIAQGRQFKSGLFLGRFVWLLASTHKDEEALFFDSYHELKQRIPELLLLIAPRHPERFQAVKQLCGQAGLMVTTRTQNDICRPQTDVYLVDTLGELKVFYAAADVAFVGGSLVATGGHNVLEAAAIGVPIIFGPYMHNFKAITKGILAKKAALQCRHKGELADMVYQLYSDPAFRNGLIENGKAFVKENQGVTAKLVELLSENID